ncbi:MAG TPA: hypothetical protein VF278_12550 [Pirellulales bacterium]
MENVAPSTSSIRQVVLAALRALGAGDGDCAEVVLVKDRLFHGRRFCLGGWQAIWIAGEGHFSVFNAAGRLVAKHPLEETTIELRRAA